LEDEDFKGLFERLKQNDFRRKFHLNTKDALYFKQKGKEEIARHAADFVSKRLAPAKPARDGKQTPWRGHPVFVAQHATGTCCRSCLLKWHQLAKGIELTRDDQLYVVKVLMTWLDREMEAHGTVDTT
jgi:hypothetical protein